MALCRVGILLIVGMSEFTVRLECPAFVDVSTGHARPTAKNHVTHVLPVVSKVEMKRVNTRRVIAVVKNVDA